MRNRIARQVRAVFRENLAIPVVGCTIVINQAINERDRQLACEYSLQVGDFLSIVRYCPRYGVNPTRSKISQ